MQVAAPFSHPGARTNAPSREAGRPAARGWSALLLPSFADIVFLLCLFTAFRAGNTGLSGDGDPARHLVLGQQILSTGTILRHNIVSYAAADLPFVAHEWLAEVASAASYRAAGLAGMVLLHSTAIALAFGVLFWHVRSRGIGALLALAVVMFAALTASVHWLVRPHVLSYLETAVFAAMLDGWQAGRLPRRWLWTLPAVMAVWVNLHGGFLIGFLLVGAYVAADVLRWAGRGEGAVDARRRLHTILPVTLATVAATALNPISPLLLIDVTDYLSGSLVRDRTFEYMSPDFHLPGFMVFLAMLLVMVAALAWSRRRPTLHEAFLLLGFTYLALYARRMVPLYAIVLAPLLASQLAALPGAVPADSRLGRLLARIGPWLARRDRRYTAMDSRATGHLWPALVLGGLVYLATAQWHAGRIPLGVQFDPKLQPVAATAYLQAHPPVGHGFNQQGWGGYLLYKLWPEQRVFIDDEVNVHTEWLAREYLQVIELQAGWQSVLDRYDVQWVLFDTNSPLVRALADSSGWRVTYQDPVATVLVRRAV